MQLSLLEAWSRLEPEKCFLKDTNYSEYRVLTGRGSWVVIRENSSFVQWEGLYFALLHWCAERGWEVETKSKTNYHEARICELTEQYSCIPKHSHTSIIEALLTAYIAFVEEKDNLDKPEVVL